MFVLILDLVEFWSDCSQGFYTLWQTEGEIFRGGGIDFGKIPRGKFSNRGVNFPRPGQNIKNTVLFSLCSAAGEKFSGFSRLYAYLRANLGDKTMICLAEVKIS